jgi:hypothetical protein
VTFWACHPGGPAAARRGGESVLPRATRLTPRPNCHRGRSGGRRDRQRDRAARARPVTPRRAVRRWAPTPLMVAVPRSSASPPASWALRLYPFITRPGRTTEHVHQRHGVRPGHPPRGRGRSAAAILLTLIARPAWPALRWPAGKTLDGAEQAIGWQLVGAPFRVSTDPTQTLPAGFDASAIPGVTAVAPASTRDGVIRRPAHVARRADSAHLRQHHEGHPGRSTAAA